MKKLLISLVLIGGFTSCERFDKEYDFRNFLRDRHPNNCIIYKVEFVNCDSWEWDYAVRDTVTGQRWIYEGNRNGFEYLSLHKNGL